MNSRFLALRLRSALWGVSSALALVAVAGVVACEKKDEETAPAPQAEASAAPSQKSAALDPALSRAMQSVTEGNKGPGAGKEDGPPENGIFAPGMADKQLRVSDPPKITLGAAGGVPKVRLGGVAKPGLKRQISLKIMLDMGASQLPVELLLALETKSEGANIRVSAKVTSAGLAGEAGSNPEAKAAFAALKGSEVSYLLAPNGVPSGFAYKASSNKSSGLAQVLIAAKDVLATVIQPFPEQSVGPDALWMVTTRQGVWDLDMVTYEMVKVTKIEGDAVTLSVDTKRYAASPNFETPFVASDAPLSLLRLEAPGQAQITFVAGDFFPISATVTDHVSAAVGPRGEPNPAERAQMVQASWSADLSVIKKP
ncbi:MAG: hypothetical protein SFV15_24385 [Polyangiaceae bacterium]|nr:hypothetical protein [Polyangiaceae bacterium]